VSVKFPAMRPRRLLRVLRHLGYREIRRQGSHRRLEALGRPPLTFAFHDNVEVPSVAVRRILVVQAKLSEDKALEAIRRA